MGRSAHRRCRQSLQHRQPPRSLAAHRSATGAEEHAHRALPVLPQQCARLTGPDVAAIHVQHRGLDGKLHSTGRFPDDQRPHRKRDAVRVPPGQLLVRAGEHRAQLRRAQRVFRRRQRKPDFLDARRSLRAAELHHAERGHAGHQVRHMAARRPQRHIDGWKLQRQLSPFRRSLPLPTRGMASKTESPSQPSHRIVPLRRRVDACPPSSPTPPVRTPSRGTCSTPRSFSRTIGR